MPNPDNWDLPPNFEVENFENAAFGDLQPLAEAPEIILKPKKQIRLGPSISLDTQLKQVLGTQEEARECADSFGIEVELEGKNIVARTPFQYWRPHNDGSLRKLKPGDQAIEYVLNYPLSLDNTRLALVELWSFLNQPGTVVYDSYRTSIHIHVNFACDTFRTVYNFMVLSLIFDELLVSQNGSHRIGNNFCLRAKDARGQVEDIIISIQSNHHFFNIDQNKRYSSINFASLLKFGSVEFRSLECTTDLGRVLSWINVLQTMKESARTFENPIQVIQQFSVRGPKEFLTFVLGSTATLYLYVKGMETMLYNGMRIAQDLAYCSDWTE